MAPPTYRAPDRRAYDVVIVGGAAVGSSTAWWLTRDPAFSGSVLVVERDATYEFASTTLSTSSIRQQFSNPINVLISQFGVDFIRNFQKTLGEDATDLGFKEHGYLTCCTAAGLDTARALVELQQSLGAHTVFLTPDEIRARFPYVHVDDLAGASWGAAAEGWFDSTGLLQGFRRSARRAGAEYVDNEVVDLVRDGARITGVVLKTGETIGCGTAVNGAGPRARMVARMAGLDLPVEPRKRHSFVFSCKTPIPGNMPNVIDISGTYVRPEGDWFLTGHASDPDLEAAVDDFETDHSVFEERIWPALAHRIPPFEAIRVETFWTGHYAYNTLDQNAIVGRHPEVTNFILANGFSGHGLQQSPAVGRAVGELIAHGAYQTLDLTPMGYERVPKNEPFVETAII